MNILKCKACKKLIKNRNQFFCNFKCFIKNAKIHQFKKCPKCKIKYTGYGKYCSQKCYWAISPKFKTNCKLCKKEFWTYPSFQKQGQGFLCSKECKYIWMSNNYRGKEYSKNCDKAPKAWSLFNHAIERKGLKRLPCKICGNKKSHGHHKDYAKPFQVDWLCAKHHQLVHTGKLKI